MITKVYKASGFLLFLFLLVPLVYGGISRDLPKQVLFGQEIHEFINITSDKDTSIQITEPVNEKLIFISPINSLVSQKVDGNEVFEYKYISREIYLKSGKSKVLEHVFKPRSLGIVYFQPISVQERNLSYEIKGQDVMVSCVPDGKCSSGENFINCQDCKENSLDGICNSKADSVCDPDCLEGDPDCNSFCGDGTCDESKENPVNCKIDCGDNIQLYKNIKYYYLDLNVNNKKMDLKNISVLTGNLYKQKSSSHLLEFRLKDVKNNVIKIFNKSVNLNNDKDFFVKIPYSGAGMKIDIYSGNVLLLNINLTLFSNYCGDGVCSEGESLCEADCGNNNLNNNNPKNTNDKGNKNIIFYICIILILIIGLVVFIKRKRQK